MKDTPVFRFNDLSAGVFYLLEGYSKSCVAILLNTKQQKGHEPNCQLCNREIQKETGAQTKEK